MLYVKVPGKPKVEYKKDLQAFNEVFLLCKKHGIVITYFSKEAVMFYDAENFKNDSVPVISFFKMAMKEFMFIIKLVSKLDTAEHKMMQYIKFVGSH